MTTHWERLLMPLLRWLARPDRFEAELPTPDRLRKMIRREWLRTDRRGGQFAVLTLGYAPGRADRRMLVRLAKLLKPRLRTSDGLGWLDPATACAVLPDAGFESAWSLAKGFLAELPDDIGRPICKIFAYPQDRAEIEALWRASSNDASPPASESTAAIEDPASPPAESTEDASSQCVGLASTGLASARNFRRMLERERSRADRLGSELSLVTLAAPSAENAHETLLNWADVLQTRLRGSDTMGWLEDDRLAITLPNTSPEGAWKMARTSLACLGVEPTAARAEVFGYPSGWLTSDVPWSEAVHALADGAAVRPLETFFVQPLPRWKRTLDVMGVLIGGMLLLPLLLLVALLVKVTSPGPVLFIQNRTGRGGVRFRMFKFRSMGMNAEAQKAALIAQNEQDGPAFKITHDPRITPLGRFIRKTSIDELPQLWNVLRGEMSLVGPRPLPCAEQDACQGWYRRRLEVTPGLTCIWQANGGLGVTFKEWMRMDARYSKARNLLEDARLILKTVGRVLLRKASR